MEKVGGRRALLVISPSVAKMFLLERIKSGAKCVGVFDQVNIRLMASRVLYFVIFDPNT
ncbi:MAG TPA: hypothetical protein VFY96_17190 [Candidatus Binatia bacterium]|nr:hypothetical protein [Candidatus Binatia bacterium]